MQEKLDKKLRVAFAQGFKTKLHTKKKGLNSQKLKLTCNDLVQVGIWIQD
jgi:hypothetical protein